MHVVDDCRENEFIDWGIGSVGNAWAEIWSSRRYQPFDHIKCFNGNARTNDIQCCSRVHPVRVPDIRVRVQDRALDIRVRVPSPYVKSYRTILCMWKCITV